MTIESTVNDNVTLFFKPQSPGGLNPRLNYVKPYGWFFFDGVNQPNYFYNSGVGIYGFNPVVNPTTRLGINGETKIISPSTGSALIVRNNADSANLASIDKDGITQIANTPTYADNATAVGALGAGRLYYRTGHGLDITF